MTKKSAKQDQDLKQSVHKVWLAGLGAVATAEEEGSKLFDRLVAKGEKFESRGKEQIDRVKDKVEDVRETAGDRWSKLGKGFDDKVSGAVERLGVPSRDEIQRLTQRVEELNSKIDPLLKKTRTTTRKSAPAKSASAKSASA